MATLLAWWLWIKSFIKIHNHLILSYIIHLLLWLICFYCAIIWQDSSFMFLPLGVFLQHFKTIFFLCPFCCLEICLKSCNCLHHCKSKIQFWWMTCENTFGVACSKWPTKNFGVFPKGSPTGQTLLFEVTISSGLADCSEIGRDFTAN